MFKNEISKKSQEKKPWPPDCVWPEPGNGFVSYWEAEDAEGMPLDDLGEDLLNIKYYMDDLVSEGRLNEDYTLNQEYQDWCDDDDDADEDEEEEWEPEEGLNYWNENEGFEL